MDKHIFNEDNGLWYELAGDYYLPCLTVPAEEKQSVGVWGQRPSGAVRLIAHKRRGRLLRQPSPLGAQSTFLLLHQRCCSGKVLLRYFLTEKVTKR